MQLERRSTNHDVQHSPSDSPHEELRAARNSATNTRLHKQRFLFGPWTWFPCSLVAMSSRALLKAALPLIAQHGLTIQAIQASAAGVDQATLNKLFPSPARATCELLNVYDQETLQSAFNKCSSQANGNDSDAWSIVSASLQSKLADSHLVREHLAQVRM